MSFLSKTDIIFIFICYFTTKFIFLQTWNSTNNWKTYNNWKNYNNRQFNSYGTKKAWNRFDGNVHTLQETNSIHSNPSEYQWQNQYKQNPFESSSRYNGRVLSRGARERRDIFEQLESFISL